MIEVHKKIIIVDDNSANLTACKYILKPYYDVFTVSSVTKMFELLEHILPNLILLDVELPDIDGYEAAKRLKNDDRYKAIPIIFLSARIDSNSEVIGLNMGALDYIHKPIISELLLRRIEMHITLNEYQKILEERNRSIEELLDLKTKEIIQRQLAEAEAYKASRAKSEFLSRMSHEIRTPLNAIIGMLSLVKETNDPQKIKNYIEKADGASHHLLALINDILDMSKIEADKFELASVNFSPEKMLANIITVANVRVEAKHQKLIVDLDNNIPARLFGDELRLSQVITNLLTNAVKFTPEEGTIALHIKKTEEAGDEITLRIEVVDNGIGISEEQQSRLFNSFEQADSSISNKFGGTGLGLAISKRIVELMGGKIWIESELGKGAKFIFTIIVKKGQEQETETTINETEKSHYDFSGWTILTIEDNEINREIFAGILEKTGISIDFAENGEIGVSMFKKNPDKYSLIMMDCQMPVMNGYDATRIIRGLDTAKAKDIPIIAMTANVFQEDVQKCIAVGMNAHVGKPIEPDILFRIIKKHLAASWKNDLIKAGKAKEMNEMKQGIKWDDELLLGDEQVDAQHHQLFTLLNSLAIACEDGTEAAKLQETLDFLVNYVKIHFSDEEALQLQSGFPEYKEHKKMHENFKLKVQHLAQRLAENGSSKELASDVNKIVARWVTDHILHKDKKIGIYLRSIQK